MSTPQTNQVTDQPAAVSTEQLLAQNEYLSTMVDVLQGQLAEATNKLTAAQVQATVFRTKMNVLGSRVTQLQGQLAEATAPADSGDKTLASADSAVKTDAGDATAAQ